MAKRGQAISPAQMGFLENYGPTAPAVPAISQAVAAWRDNDYLGATDASRTLLNHWFYNDHKLPNGARFQYYRAQQAAIESLIYVYEVAKIRQAWDLYERFIPRDLAGEIAPPESLPFARYCTKMATGSGKTKVMALAIAWQYFNAIENPRDYAMTFLVIAPNIIVFERLKADFAGGRIFKTDPVIPKELQIYWDMQCYMRGDAERASSTGALYLTNIQQLYARADRQRGQETPQMTAMLGSQPPAALDEGVDFRERILQRSGAPLMVINDEAHHTHDYDSEWNRAIRALGNQHAQGLSAQLDFSATPRHGKGTLFAWTISDYPLRQAIIDGIVKRPLKGITDIGEVQSDRAHVRFQAYITAGIERWREYRDQLAPLKKKPLLFIMLNKTKEADEVGDYLRRTYPDHFAGDKTLIIHTDRKGEVSRKDLDAARRAAKDVDSDSSEINAIVSVLMLREGWDVQNVTVIVGLRPYSAKANILPEQTIGRGLRLMFRGERSTYKERVDVIGNDGFLDFIAKLEADEDYQFGSWQVGKERLQITTIEPMAEKAEYDIALPLLSPGIVRSRSLRDDIEALDIDRLYAGAPLPRQPDEEAARTFKYQGKDLLTSEELLEREYSAPIPQTSQEIVAYYADRLAKDLRIPGQFAALAPKVRDFLRQRAFGESVDLDSAEIRAVLAQPLHQALTMRVFADALRDKLNRPQRPVLESAGRPLSALEPFAWSQLAPVCRKTVFNKTPCENHFEEAFARFLDKAADVQRFAKLPERFGFSIPYLDTRGNLRRYYPDFVAVDAASLHCLVETKGRQDIDVARKDDAAHDWAQRASQLTGQTWRYVKVLQEDFEAQPPAAFADLARA